MTYDLETILSACTLASALWIGFSTNKIAKQANDISSNALAIERDKIIMDWSRRVSNCYSETIALRMMNHDAITLSKLNFHDERRKLRTKAYSLIDEGGLFLPENGDILNDLKSNLAESLKGTVFKPFDKDNYNELLAKKFKVNSSNFTIQAKKLVRGKWEVNQ